MDEKREAAATPRSCRQCFGDLVRLDGRLRCGTCGWSAARDGSDKIAPLTVSPETVNAQLLRRVQELEKVNTELARRSDEERAHPIKQTETAVAKVFPPESRPAAKKRY